ATRRRRARSHDRLGQGRAPARLGARQLVEQRWRRAARAVPAPVADLRRPVRRAPARARAAVRLSRDARAAAAARGLRGDLPARLLRRARLARARAATRPAVPEHGRAAGPVDGAVAEHRTRRLRGCDPVVATAFGAPWWGS